MVDEESFPRGGKVLRKRPHQDNETLFSLAKPSKAKKVKKAKTKEPQKQSSDDLVHTNINIRGSLTYKKIQTGMVVLGCVRHVMNLAIEVELPGLCSACISITEISDPFTKYLNRQLEEGKQEVDNILHKMFSVGDYLPVKITNIEANEKGSRVAGTINPREIHSEFSHSSFKKEMLVWSSIVSEADHGYEMSLGVQNCRAFLPSKNLDADVEYLIGKPIWCVVHKVNIESSASIIRLSAKTEHIKAVNLDIDNLHYVIPGTKVEFLTDKVYPHGIQGKFSEQFVGYVEENYLKKPLMKPTDYQEGKLLTAFVLFVEPTTKITHLTLRFPEKEEKHGCNVGDIVQGEVFGKPANGLYFILPHKLKGFTTNRRLINSLGKKDNLDVAEAINLKFPLGSKHQCRIIDYNRLSQLLICTPEVSVVKEKKFIATDLSPGQPVDVKIIEIKEEGIVVLAGHVRGFVTNLHITNTEYTNNVKKKFKEGQQVSARVLSIEDDNVLFTLKPALVENDECLAKIEDAKVGAKYPGVVSKISETGALVVFYANVKGWISQKGMGAQATDPSKYFFMGQVVSLYIWRLDDSRIYLSIFRPQIKSNFPNVGGRYIGVVKSINNEGIHVQIENRSERGFIPNAHLSSSLSLCLAVKRTLVKGDTIPDLMYMGGTKPKIYSKREGAAARVANLPKLEALEVGHKIRCSYQNSSDNGIYVLPHIQNYGQSVFVNKKSIGQDIPELVPHQLLIAKITYLDQDKKEIGLSVKMKEVFDRTVEGVINLFTQYLLELRHLYIVAEKKKLGIAEYNPGDRVKCKVDKIGPEGGCVADLPNGVKGIATPFLCPKNLKEGDEIPGVVLGHNFEKQYVDLCLKQDLAGKINPQQNGALKQAITSSFTEKLLVKDECIIGLLKHPSGNKQLVYLPTRLHENDFEGCASYYEKPKLKVCVCGRMKKFLIGMSKKMFIDLDKMSRKNKIVPDNILITQERTATKRKEIKTKNQLVTVETKLENEEVKDKRRNSESDSGIEPEDDNEVDVESEADFEAQASTNNELPKTSSITLPGITSFFNIHPKKPLDEESSSSDDEENGPTERKKKKLSPAERAELLRQEEERISKIEKELADPNKPPESADQFDRVLLAKPDSAELWAKYIAFHIAATEIDKARAVAKRALDTINMTLTEEKFKIWMVLLNLENMFGTKESFDKTFEDALKFNDSLQVYLKTIAMLAENAKYTEMEEKINKVRTKHKQDPTMWLEVGKTYYQIQKFNEARNCKDRALKSITDKKSQMMIIVRYAIMEFKYGEPDQGCAIFEAILMSEPRKVNIWISYVDQLVKLERIEEARQVLERAVCQKLPLKMMKSLFMKFRKFEEVHGTPETIETVKRRAQDYVANFGK